MPLSKQSADELRALIKQREADQHPDLVVHVVHRSEDECEVEVEGAPDLLDRLVAPGSYTATPGRKINEKKAVFGEAPQTA